MAILNPDHLLDQANRLSASPAAGPPRQVDLRRAISAVYYATFHEIITGAANQIVGFVHRNSREHGLVCRSIDHATIRYICIDLGKPTIPTKYSPYIPDSGFGPELGTIFANFPDLMEARHTADYDTLRRFLTSDAKASLLAAQTIIDAFRAAPSDKRKAFLFLLLFPPKR